MRAARVRALVLSAVCVLACLSACGGAAQDHGQARIAPPSTAVRATIVLKGRPLQSLGGLPAARPAGRGLAAAAFGVRFGLSHAELAHVERRLRGAGFVIESRHPQRTALEVRGTARALTRLFGVRLGEFRTGSARRFHAPIGRVEVPPDLEAAVAGVTGLDGRPVPIATAQAPARPPAGALLPRDVARAYGIRELWRGGILGQGQTIAVVSFATFAPSDLRGFETRVGIRGAGPVERIAVAGGTEDVTSAEAREVALDVQTIRGLAPRARILNYELPYRGLSDFTSGIGEAIDRIVADGRAKVVSVSYGICDMETHRDGTQWLPEADRLRMNRSLAAAAAAGVSVFIATHDYGAYACQSTDAADDRVAVSWPADLPGAVAVGGTRLWLRPDGSYLEEAGWEDVISGGGSGGGLNPSDSRPPWQRGLGGEAAAADGRRLVPDVAALGDPDSGVLVVFGGREISVGGTSAAAPIWAATMLLVRQFAQRVDAGPLPFAPEMLYEVARRTRPQPPFHDVVRGGNRLQSAGPGWDFATGLGTPNAWNLAREAVRWLHQRR